MSDNIEKNGEEISEELKEETAAESEAEAEKKKAEADRPVVFEEAVEAILFAAGHPISYATLARVFEMTPGKIKDKIFEYSLRYNDPSIPRGVILLTYKDSCQLSTKQYYLNEIRDALGIKKSGSLSTSSMEALAIIAYNQPVTRIFVDTLRRADSSYAMNNLLDRGLIEPKGRLDAPGRPMLYGTTPDFLRVFGLKDIESLPRTTDEMKEIFAKTRNVEVTEGAVQEEMAIDEDGNITESAESTELINELAAEDIPDNTDDTESDVAADESDDAPDSYSDEDEEYGDETESEDNGDLREDESADESESADAVREIAEDGENENNEENADGGVSSEQVEDTIISEDTSDEDTEG